MAAGGSGDEGGLVPAGGGGRLGRTAAGGTDGCGCPAAPDGEAGREGCGTIPGGRGASGSATVPGGGADWPGCGVGVEPICPPCRRARGGGTFGAGGRLAAGAGAPGPLGLLAGGNGGGIVRTAGGVVSWPGADADGVGWACPGGGMAATDGLAGRIPPEPWLGAGMPGWAPVGVLPGAGGPPAGEGAVAAVGW